MARKTRRKPAYKRSAYMPDTLEPLAKVKVDENRLAGQDPTDPGLGDRIDEASKALFSRHRGGNGSTRVQERRWDALPKSEKGKYRRIIVDAMAGKF